MHTDCNDKVSKCFQNFVGEICDSFPTWSSWVEDGIVHDVCNYLLRYQKCIGKQLGLNTVCCWKALKNDSCHSKTENSFLQYFCCESLGFTMDISSTALRECLQTCYGAIFQSSFIKHGTSFPLLNYPCDGIVSYSPSNSMWIPFAWGRSGGSKKNKNPKRSKSAEGKEKANQKRRCKT